MNVYWRERGLVPIGVKTISPANRRTAVLPARGVEATAAIQSNIGVLPQRKGPHGRSAQPLSSREDISVARLLPLMGGRNKPLLRGLVSDNNGTKQKPRFAIGTTSHNRCWPNPMRGGKHSCPLSLNSVPRCSRLSITVSF